MAKKKKKKPEGEAAEQPDPGGAARTRGDAGGVAPAAALLEPGVGEAGARAGGGGGDVRGVGGPGRVPAPAQAAGLRAAALPVAAHA